MAITRQVVDLTDRRYINDGISKYCNLHHAVHDRGAVALELAGGSEINAIEIAKLAMQHGCRVDQEPWRDAYIACIEANRALSKAAAKIGALLPGPKPPVNGPVAFLT